MQDSSERTDSQLVRGNSISPWRIVGWVCAGVIVASVLACVLVADSRSRGLVAVTVTALDADAEPRDHNLPLVQQKEALPDYELSLLLSDGRTVALGSKPDTSAVGELTWHINDPVNVAEVASVRLQEKDKVISDTVAEVQVRSDVAMANGYRFEFQTQRSASVGVKSFFGTPIGLAIAGGFFIAVLLAVVSAGAG